jgi:16S rRNA (adenine1518-N6/adenine1519-N6)-dimethyltransferase
MQKLGQHFLKNAAVLEKIVGALALAEGDRVIEIGPGHGELTAPLAIAARGKHCGISCIEKDHTLIENLNVFAVQENSVAEESGKKGDARIKIIEGDALKLLPEMSATKIVGNIPYYITGKLLRVISELEQKPERVVLLIQKEVAERICAAPPDMNRLAASVQFWANATIIAGVPRNDFSPPPEVDSTVIMLENKKFSPEETLSSTSAKGSVIDSALYYRAVRGIFAQPRKTLLNNLTAMAADKVSKSEIIKHLKNIDINPESRPQDLGVPQIVTIAKLPLWG